MVVPVVGAGFFRGSAVAGWDTACAMPGPWGGGRAGTLFGGRVEAAAPPIGLAVFGGMVVAGRITDPPVPGVPATRGPEKASLGRVAGLGGGGVVIPPVGFMVGGLGGGEPLASVARSAPRCCICVRRLAVAGEAAGRAGIVLGPVGAAPVAAPRACICELSLDTAGEAAGRVGPACALFIRGSWVGRDGTAFCTCCTLAGARGDCAALEGLRGADLAVPPRVVV